MKTSPFAALSLLVFSGCFGEATPVQEKITLTEARRDFKPKIVAGPSQAGPVAEPPPSVFQKVIYESPVGNLQAYLSVVPEDGQKRPAIVWITGGDCNSIDDVWTPASPDNDQTAAAYRKAGIILMFPSLRGGNDNPGKKESYYGEVDDVIAAARFLAQQESVDPSRIYLGGHSTGGTLALLVAESTDKFRAVFSFGPVSDVTNYSSQYTQFDKSNPREVALRSPGRWLSSVKSPTFIIEGTDGNISSLEAMKKSSTNPQVHFVTVAGASHFSVLAPANRAIATKILQDKGTTTSLTLSEAELK
jgi:dipeptidyl aminopeptidase/acylaminoacyl peptidase